MTGTVHVIDLHGQPLRRVQNLPLAVPLRAPTRLLSYEAG